MIKIIQSVTKKIYNINEKCDKILDIKKYLVKEMGGVRLKNLKILVKDENKVYEANDNENTSSHINSDKFIQYILVIVPIECPHSHHN